MRTVAFIPARKGSKGLPGKNKKKFAGKPLIQWSIEQAQESKVFDDIIVSTDDKAILSIADKCGVTGHLRLKELATDTATMDEVMYDFFSRPGHEYDYICLLNPTSPLRLPEDISKMFRFIKMKKYWTVISVQWCDFIGWAGNVKNKGPLPFYNLQNRPNRQTRDDFVLENGTIYWFMHEIFIAYGNMIANPAKVKLYEMPAERSLEIDTPFDFYMNEKAYEWGCKK